MDAREERDRRWPARRLRGVAITAAVALLILTACGREPSTPAPDQPSAPATPTPLSATALDRTGEIMARLTKRSGPDDPRYYAGGEFRDGSPDCFRCTLGPAVLAATYGVHRPDQKSIGVAVATFDRAIAGHQRADGSITPASPGEGGPGIQTTLFANALASTYLILGSQLDAAHRQAWARSLTRSADYLIGQKTLDFYVNGNINLSLTVNMDLSYRITGHERFRLAADQSLAFTQDPPQDRWPGFGLRYAKEPLSPDGADGAGYLAETGGDAPGFDPAYSLYQLDIASLWFLLTGDPAALRLTNLLYNQLQPLVRASEWTIDVSGGTRRGAPGTRYAFTVSAVAVLALKGGRTDLQPLVRPQVTKSLDEFTGATGYTHPGLSNSYGAQLAPAVAVITQTPGW